MLYSSTCNDFEDKALAQYWTFDEYCSYSDSRYESCKLRVDQK